MSRDIFEQVAEGVPFDKENNDFDAEDVQTAIEEIDFRSETKEPTGILDENRTSVITFDSNTRIFTIAPKPPLTSFKYFIRGKEYIVSTPKTTTIPDIEGRHFVHFEGDTLVNSQTPWSFEGLTAFVCLVQWDGDNKVKLFINDERHGLSLPWSAHRLHHYTNGFAPCKECLAEVVNFTYRGDGTTNEQAKFGITAASYFDEDIRIDVVDTPTPTDIFEQTTTPYINIPVFYKEGNGKLRKKEADSYPLIWDGINTVKYNAYDEITDTWSLQNVTEGNYIGIYIFATDCIEHPYIAILGDKDASNAADAVSTTIREISEGLPFQEIYPLYRVVYRTSVSFTNEPKATTIDFVLGADSFAETDRSFFIANYNGNGNVGRYLEVFPGESSDNAPYPVPEDAFVRIASISSSAPSSNGAVSVFRVSDLNTPIATVNFNNTSKQTKFFSVFVPAGSGLAFRVTGGAVSKPKIAIWMQTQFGG